MSGLLISCCNTGPGTGPFHVAYRDLATGETSWLKLDEQELRKGGLELARITGATGLCTMPSGYLMAVQGPHDPAFVLEYSPDFQLRKVHVLPGVRDIHSLKVYGDDLFIASTGNNQVIRYNLKTSESGSHFLLRPSEHIPNSHLNDYVRFEGREYVLAHSDPAGPEKNRDGIVYSIDDRAVVMNNLEHPHTFIELDGKLFVLDSARGRVRAVAPGAEQVPIQLASGGILRGASRVGDKLYLATSSRRLFSRKRGLAQMNVPDGSVVYGDEAFMAWIWEWDLKKELTSTKISFSEINFEIYDILFIEGDIPQDRLAGPAAALRAQSARHRVLALTKAQLRADAQASAASTSDPGGPRAAGNGGGEAEFGENENLHIVRSPGSTKTIIAFAGLAQLIGGMVPYNFMQSLHGIDANVIFIRDPLRTWYNGPIPGVGKTYKEIGARLAAVAKELGTQELYLLGSSSGGFGALALSKLLCPKRVLSFSPQTSINLDYLTDLGETRWIRPISRIKSPEITDLVSVLEDGTETKYELIIGAKVKLDVVYANRLAQIKNMRLHFLDGPHNTAAHLKKEGQLATVLQDFVSDKNLSFEIEKATFI